MIYNDTNELASTRYFLHTRDAPQVLVTGGSCYGNGPNKQAPLQGDDHEITSQVVSFYILYYVNT